MLRTDRSGGHSRIEFDLRAELETTKQLFNQLAKHDLLATRNLLVRLGPSQHEQRRCQSVQAARLPLNMADEPVTLLWHFAGSGLQTLDRTRDRRQRRSQLVGGVRDELALRAAAPLSIRDIVQHEQHRLRASRRDPGELEDTLAIRAGDFDLDAFVGVEQAGSEGAKRETKPRLRDSVDSSRRRQPSAWPLHWRTRCDRLDRR